MAYNNNPTVQGENKFSIDLSELNEPQREAVTHGQGPMLILAGAGSGKTRVITYRIAYLLESGIKPWNILAVTFTNKAAGEMRERVFHLTGGSCTGVWISTFHSFCAQFLRIEGHYCGIPRDYTIYDEDDQKKVIKECLKELNLDEKKLRSGTLVNRISREKDQLMDAESFAISAAATGDPNKEMFAVIYSLYQKKLDNAGALDFGDLIMKTVEILNGHTGLREKYQERFHYVLVDEYQDTNRGQYVLTKTFAAKHKNICVVGDDDQAIYSWRGADIRNILDFEKDYPTVKVVKLEQNYRSTLPILNAAWNLVQNNEMRKEKKLWTARTSETQICLVQTRDELEEAKWVAEKIAEIQEETQSPLSRFAVFYRTNAQSRVLEDALRNGQIPYVLVGNVRFYERAEVKDALAYLRLIVNPKDNLSFKRIVNYPHRGIGKTTLDALEKFAMLESLSLFESLGRDEFLQTLSARAHENLSGFRAMMQAWIVGKSELTASQLVKEILAKTKILDILEEEAKNDIESAARLDNVQELLNAIEEFEEKAPEKTASAYLEQVSLLTNIDMTDKKKSGVTLMTVHLAKGLEFPVVFLTGLEEGLFPLGESQFTQEGLEEERRLAYVGMTRAKDQLFLTSSASRKLYGQTHWNVPSQFIAEAGLSIKPVVSSPSNFQSSFESDGEKAQGFFELRIGQRVNHPIFGNGKVTQKSGSGENLKVVVMFDSGQWKKLFVKHASLRRI